MRVPYLPGKTKLPQPSLAGGTARYRPITAVRITGPGGSWLMDGVLDTGADDTIFPASVAALIGLDLSQVAPHNVHLTGRAKPISCRFLRVELRLTDGIEAFTWDAVVGFVPFPIKAPLLGHAGCLQYFDADFRGSDREVVIRTNTSFLGTRS